MHENLFIIMAKKKIEKIIVDEFYKKDVIDFGEYNSIIKKLDDDIAKLESRVEIKENMTNMIVKIPI